MMNISTLEVFPNIPLVAVVEYYETLPGNFLRNLERFDSYVSGGLAFSYTDDCCETFIVEFMRL